MKKILVFLILIVIILLQSCHKKVIVNKSIIPSFFIEQISNYDSYDKNYLYQYYCAYLDFNSYIYALNYVNHPVFLNNEISKPALSLNNIILVNRRFYLDAYTIPTNLTPVQNVKYVKRKNEIMMIDEVTLQNYQKMEIILKQNNIDIVLFSAYRSYEKQLSLWDNNRKENDSFLAKPGFSEHQTGLAIDIGTLNSGLTIHFENTKTFKFLKEHAHEYGFILRYPKNKESITGYAYEPWHFRYVGREVAKIIYDNNLTLEEYFYQYLEIPI